MERDIFFASVFVILFDFNSHAHVERDIFFASVFVILFDFNSHAHVERDVVKMYKHKAIKQFQLTRSRGA